MIQVITRPTVAAKNRGGSNPTENIQARAIDSLSHDLAVVGDQHDQEEERRLARLWDHKPGVAAWWERAKARPSFDKAFTQWLRPQDWQRYEKMPDPWPDVSKNLAAV